MIKPDASCCKDFAGVRVAVYFPDDVRQVKDLIICTCTLRGPEKIFPIPPRKSRSGYVYEYPGYTATHYLLSLNILEDRDVEYTAYSECKVEVQVATLLMHAWSEVEHDLVYKEIDGRVSPNEEEILDRINGIMISAEKELRQLQIELRRRISTNVDQFRTELELIEFIRSIIPISQNNQSGYLRNGRVDSLLSFLREIGLDTPVSLRFWITLIPENSIELSENLAHLIADSSDEFTRAYNVWFTAQTSTDENTHLSTSLSGTPESGRTRFFQAWFGLKREIERINNSRIELPAGDLVYLEALKGLDFLKSSDVQIIRGAYGSMFTALAKPPISAASLFNAGADRLEPVIERLSAMGEN